MKAVLFSIAFAASAFAQPLSFGIKAGVPVSDSFTPAGVNALKTNFPTYAVGPTVEFSLPGDFGIEVDGLFQPLEFTALRSVVGSSTIDFTHTTGSSWEFPVLLKYRLPLFPLRPFLQVGASERIVSDLNETSGVETFRGRQQQTGSTTRPIELQNRFSSGFVIGGGVEVGSGHFHFSPEFRYTRWAWDNFVSPSSNLNQAEFLVGFRF